MSTSKRPGRLRKLWVAIVKDGRVIRYHHFDDPRKIFCSHFNSKGLGVKAIPVSRAS